MAQNEHLVGRDLGSAVSLQSQGGVLARPPPLEGGGLQRGGVFPPHIVG